MYKKIFLLICIFSYTKETSPQHVSSIIRTSYEQIRGFLDKVNNVTRVRTVEELLAKGNEFTTLDFIGLVQKYDGYKAEEYEVQTEDGYILKLHRISSSPLSSKSSKKPVVYMHHSLAASSDIFVSLGPDYDLAFTLADKGYDVWLGNARGNSYSKRHVKYSSASTDYDFWKFDLDDLATKDVPAFIDTILEKTNKKKLIYIGYAMGNTLSYMLLSSKPEYNKKIALSVSLTPFVYFLEPDSSFLLFSKSVFQSLIPVARAMKFYELTLMSKLNVVFTKTVCANFLGKYLCGFILSPCLTPQNMNLNIISSMFSGLIDGSSLDVFDHFGQLAAERKFRKFNFGSHLNQQKYNTSEPPEYNLSKVTAPQAIFYADDDTFINPKGVEKLKKDLKNVISFEKVPESYQTCDFIWAKNARDQYYYKILKIIKKFS